MRRLTQGIKLVPALENDEPSNQPIVVEAPADNANSLETDMIEVADHSADIAALDAEAAETAAVMEALEGISVCLGESAKNGGMDRYSAQAVGIAVDALYERVGIKRSSFPALESFGGSSSRPTATKIAMESIQEQIKKIWEAIVSAFEKAIAWAVDFWNKVTDAAGKLTKRGEELAKKAGELKGEAKEKTIKNERISASLATSKGAGDKASIEHTVNVVKAAVGPEMSKAVEEQAKSAISAMENVAKFLDTFELKPIGGSAMQKADPAASGHEAAPEGLVFKRSEELSGGKAILVYGTDEVQKGEAAVKGAGATKVALGAFDTKKAPEAKELPTLSGADAAGIASAVAELGKVLVAARDEAGKINESKKHLLEKAKSLAKAAAALDEKSEDHKQFKAAQVVAQYMVRTADQPRASVSAYGLSVGKAALDYVELSLKAYSAEAEKKDDKAAAPAAAPAAAAA